MIAEEPMPEACPLCGRVLITSYVLRPEPRLGAVRADVDEPERPPGQDRQRQRRAEDLPAALALRAVDLDHGVAHGGKTRAGPRGFEGW